MSLKKDINLIFELGTMRYITRAWTQFLNKDVANLSEHTFRVIWIALVIAKHEGPVNEEKMIKMALLHDVGESRTGDAHYVAKPYVSHNDDEAMADIYKDSVLQKEIMELWEEYQKKECIESKIVKDADNLDVDFELQELEAQGSQIKTCFEPRRQKRKESLYTQTARDMFDELKKTSPFEWVDHVFSSKH